MFHRIQIDSVEKCFCHFMNIFLSEYQTLLPRSRIKQKLFTNDLLSVLCNIQVTVIRSIVWLKGAV